MCTVTGFTTTLNKAQPPLDAPDDLVERSYKVAYDYKVMWDGEDTEKEFTATVDTMGGGTYFDAFGDLDQDKHQINRSTRMPVTRVLDIPAHMLDHFWGDNLVLKLHIEGASGDVTEAFCSTKVEHEAA